MASPFADLTNIRLRWERPGNGIPDMREGGLQSMDVLVIEAFAKVPSIAAPAAVGGVQLAPGGASIYVTRWALLPPSADWLGTGAGWTWTETGLRPAGLRAGARMQAFRGDLGDLPVQGGGELGLFELHEINPPFGDGGVGAEIRAAAGDKLVGTLTLGR
jgi:hypothetical protein